MVFDIDVMNNEQPVLADDIQALYLLCPSCDHEWRAYDHERCTRCARSIGTTLVLNEAQIETLMNAVNNQEYGVNSEDDIMFVLSEMISESWFNVPALLLAQACWIHLSSQRSTPFIQEGMAFFEERYQECVDTLEYEDNM